LGVGAAAHAQHFERPFRITAYGVPITVDVGHAQPLFLDFDGDGKRDLLVGQYGDGRLRIYRNFGTDSVPYFRIFEWLAAGDSVAKVAAG
jgi:FG-GAP repeat protein